jgi:hypothetical protein
MKHRYHGALLDTASRKGTIGTPLEVTEPVVQSVRVFFALVAELGC